MRTILRGLPRGRNSYPPRGGPRSRRQTVAALRLVNKTKALMSSLLRHTAVPAKSVADILRRNTKRL